MSKVNMVILDRYVPTVLEELLPNDEWSKVGYGAHAVDVRIQGPQPSRSIHLDENPRFYEGFRALVLVWVSCVSHCQSMVFTAS
jgi:hypothetical protein